VHPAQRGLLIHETVVARKSISGLCIQGGVRQEAQHAEAVIDHHDQGVGFFRNSTGIVVPARTHSKRAAVNVDQHRQAAAP
jgi:hypothetical protein